MYREILVPTDGSDGANRAVDHAAELAAEQGARLHLLFVVNPTASTYDGVAYDFREAMEEAGERVVADARDRVEAAGVADVEVATVHDAPHRGIVDYAEDNGVDLIVVGTHGRTGLGRMLLGSVTEKVVRIAPVPVLTVRAPDEEEAESGES